jgi:hypothetical protein
MNKAIKSVLLLSALTLGIQNASAQTCNTNMIKTAPDSRYTNNGDGSVYDKDTELTWMRCSIGQTWESVGDSCNGTISKMTWEGALQTASTKNIEALLGESDWRLPNIQELASLVEFACNSPSINETQFPNTRLTYYWSSSVVANSGSYAWNVNFNNGYDGGHNRRGVYRVRLVRGGQ